METATSALMRSNISNKIEIKTKYCLYARKSTESEERQVLSIDSQIKEMLQLAEREIVEEVKKGKYNGILTWAPDRISRNAGDLGKIVDLMDSGHLQEIRTFSQKFSNNPNEKFLLMILGSQAKLENDNRGVNVKRGLRARLEMGLWPTQAPLGYLNQYRMDKKGELLVDPDRAHIVKKILQNPFYYGMMEYPKDSGNWYQGKHEPLITKELFEETQKRLKRDDIHRTNKEFTFTRLFVCGYCGSTICAEEKWRQLKDGTNRKYIYYGCGRAKDRNCKNKYIQEGELIEELLKIIDQINIDEIGMRYKLEDEIKRFNIFQRSILGSKDKTELPTETDIKNYAKYILKEGNDNDKREVLQNLKSRIILRDKMLIIK